MGRSLVRLLPGAAVLFIVGLFIPLWIGWISVGVMAVLYVGLTLWVYHTQAEGGINDLWSREGRYRFKLRTTMAADRHDMIPVAVQGYIMDRHRSRTGCPGEVYSQRRKLAKMLPRRWELGRMVIGGHYYCDTCKERVTGKDLFEET